MAQCEVCGNDYDMAFEVHAQGGRAHLRQLRVRDPPDGAGLRTLRVQGHRAWCAGRRQLLLLRALRPVRRFRRGARPGVGGAEGGADGALRRQSYEGSDGAAGHTNRDRSAKCRDSLGGVVWLLPGTACWPSIREESAR